MPRALGGLLFSFARPPRQPLAARMITSAVALARLTQRYRAPWRATARVSAPREGADDGADIVAEAISPRNLRNRRPNPAPKRCVGRRPSPRTALRSGERSLTADRICQGDEQLSTASPAAPSPFVMLGLALPRRDDCGSRALLPPLARDRARVVRRLARCPAPSSRARGLIADPRAVERPLTGF
jgi:hypothetical protein